MSCHHMESSYLKIVQIYVWILNNKKVGGDNLGRYSLYKAGCVSKQVKSM